MKMKLLSQVKGQFTFFLTMKNAKKKLNEIKV